MRTKIVVGHKPGARGDVGVVIERDSRYNKGKEFIMSTATLDKTAPVEIALADERIANGRIVARGLSFDEFILAPQFNGRHVEWVEGEVIEKMSVSLTHSLLVVFLTKLLGLVTELNNGGSVLADQFLMRLEDQERGREPDIIYVAPENESRLLSNYLDGPADLAIEVISRGSEVVDRGAKFEEYERGGVREFWLLDPHRREALFYVRDAEGLFRPGLIQDGIYQSAVLPLVRLRVEWLWEQPPIMDILREWNLL